MAKHRKHGDYSTAFHTSLEALAAFAAEAEIAPGAATIGFVRDALIDTLGCILVGTREEVSRKARCAFDTGGARRAAVYGARRTAAPASAALLNAVAGHALDFDDWEFPGNTHPSVVLFPALLAATAGSAVSGEKLVDAYLVGYETIACMGEATNFEHYKRGWHTTATLGPIGAAAGVARILGFDRGTAGHALSIAVSRAAGYTCQFGSDAKPLQAGFAAETGVVAAELAAAGLTGQPSVLDAPDGFNALMAHGDAARFAAPFDRLGRGLAFERHGLIFKAYPSCGYTHRIIDCARALREQGLGHAASIARIVLSLPDFHARILPFRRPHDRREARFSLPFCAAAALTRGDLAITDFETEIWRDPGIDRLIGLTQVRPFRPKDPLRNYDPDEPDSMVVELRDGSRREAAVSFPSGAPQNPLSTERLLAKFRRNAELTTDEFDDQAIECLVRWPAEPDLHAILPSPGEHQ